MPPKNTSKRIPSQLKGKDIITSPASNNTKIPARPQAPGNEEGPKETLVTALDTSPGEGAKKVKQRSKNWTAAELPLLTQAGMSVNMDSRSKADNKLSVLHEKIFKIFNTLRTSRNTEDTSRSGESCWNKYLWLKKECKKMYGFLLQAYAVVHSGWTEDDNIVQANQQWVNEELSDFELWSCHDILKPLFQMEDTTSTNLNDMVTLNDLIAS